MIQMNPRRPRRQQGTALIVALVMLIAMTVLGLTSARSTLMQEQMTGNKRQKQVAFEGAEAAVRMGEAQLWASLGGAPPNARQPATCGPCPVYAANSFDPLAGATWDTANNNVALGPDMPGMAERPTYYVEHERTVGLTPMTGIAGGGSELRYYKVTGRSTGQQQRVESIVRSTFLLIF